MPSTPVARLRNHEVLPKLAEVVARDRSTTAEMLDLLAEAQARRLHAPTRYPSMYEYCVGELRMSEDMAYTRVKVAELARAYPAILPALADGHLHLAGVRMLGPYLTSRNAAELLAAAAHRSKAEIALLLAERFPRPDVPTTVMPLPAAETSLALVPERLEFPSFSGNLGSSVTPDGAPREAAVAPELDGLAPTTPATATPATSECSPADVACAPASSSPTARPAPHVATPLPRTHITPLSPGRFKFEATFDAETLELLDRARALLAHTMPGADRALVVRRVLRDWVQATERRKYGLTDKPRAQRMRPANERTIPNAIKRAVHERDRGRCTFVGDDGERCEARDFLEFDHITPLARGGLTTGGNIRLLCRTHNQHEAERRFGAGFVAGRREASRRRVDAKGTKRRQGPQAPGLDTRAAHP